MNKKKLLVVMGITLDMAFAAANVLMSLNEFPPDKDFDVLIFEDGLSSHDKDLLSKIRQCRFESFEFPKEFNISTKLLKRYSKMVFCKYECFDLLENYRNVLWLDIDIIIKGETKELLEYAKSGAGFILEPYVLQINFSEKIDGYDMQKKFYNAGVFILNDSFPNWRQAKKNLYDRTKKYADILLLVEQGIINLFLLDSKVEPTNIPAEYNSFPEFHNIEQAKIIHVVDYNKPWISFKYKIWNDNYKLWLKMGGTPLPFNKSLRYACKNIPHALKYPRGFGKKIFSIANFLAKYCFKNF
jgi:lipopolysaccharide biosynthesis glycosyltransferase